MKKRSNWKKVTQETLDLVQSVHVNMDAAGKSTPLINKAVMAITGIKTTGVIKRMRDSDYNIEKYRELNRKQYPQSYGLEPNGSKKNTNNILPLDYANDCESQVYFYLDHFYGGNQLKKIKLLADIITTLSSTANRGEEE